MGGAKGSERGGGRKSLMGDDGNITSVNKSSNLGRRSAVVHGPSTAPGARARSGNVQRVAARKGELIHHRPA